MNSDKPTIFQKLSAIQCELLNCNIKKSGFNNFKKYHYYELSDLLPPILELCRKHDCAIFFIFGENEAILKFYSNDGRQDISTRIPLPELEPINSGTNLIQSSGAYQTYCKKYLLLNLFCISETDIIDMGDTSEKSEPSKKQKSTKPKSTDNFNFVGKGKPLGWGKLEDYVSNSNKDVSELTKDDFNKARFQMAKKGLITPEENKALYEYLTL